MKKILLIVFLFVIASKLYSQKKYSFYNDFTAGVYSNYKTPINPLLSNSVGLYYKKFNFGIGLQYMKLDYKCFGFDLTTPTDNYYINYDGFLKLHIMPVYVDFKYIILNKKISPLIYIDFGKSFVLNNKPEMNTVQYVLQDSTYHEIYSRQKVKIIASFFLKSGLGITYKVNDKIHLDLLAGIWVVGFKKAPFPPSRFLESQKGFDAEIGLKYIFKKNN
jgi:hypothetical protein